MLMLNQVVLGIFFLYFILMSDQCSLVLNCGLQRYIAKEIWIKHFAIFMSIYIFTFVLNWYTFDSLVVESFQTEEEKIAKSSSSLLTYLYYSIAIYVIFIISTKNEGPFLGFFLVSTIVLVFLQIYLKSINSDLYDRVRKNTFITADKKRQLQKNVKDTEVSSLDLLVNMHNIMMVLYLVIIISLLYGFNRYFQRQYKDHKKNWSWISFIFGTNRCGPK